jgi:cbb3-type cytochrome oxidase subunit 3
MIKSILTHIGGIEHYGLISMGLFVFVFVGMLIWVFTMKKSHLDHMAAAPLDQQTETKPSETRHE